MNSVVVIVIQSKFADSPFWRCDFSEVKSHDKAELWAKMIIDDRMDLPGGWGAGEQWRAVLYDEAEYEASDDPKPIKVIRPNHKRQQYRTAVYRYNSCLMRTEYAEAAKQKSLAESLRKQFQGDV